MELTLFHLSSQFSGSCLHGLSLEELPGLLWWKNSEKKQRNFCPVSMDNCWKSSSCAWEMFLEIIQKTSFVGGGSGGWTLSLLQPESAGLFICQFRLELRLTQSTKHSVLPEFNQSHRCPSAQTILLCVVVKLLLFKWNPVLLPFSVFIQILYLCSKGQD